MARIYEDMMTTNMVSEKQPELLGLLTHGAKKKKKQRKNKIAGV